MPDLHAAPFSLDTDGDGLLDTSLVDDGVDLIFGTDLDADGIVDRVLRIGPDGAVRAEPSPGEEDDSVVGSVRVGWTGLFDGLLGPDP